MRWTLDLIAVEYFPTPASTYMYLDSNMSRTMGPRNSPSIGANCDRLLPSIVVPCHRPIDVPEIQDCKFGAVTQTGPWSPVVSNPSAAWAICIMYSIRCGASCILLKME